MNGIQEKIYAALGLLIIPPTVGSFVFLKEEKIIQVDHCEISQGRRGDTIVIHTDDGEELQIAPGWMGGTDEKVAKAKLCPRGKVKVSIRGARIDQLSFWDRLIFKVG